MLFGAGFASRSFSEGWLYGTQKRIAFKIKLF
jgi:hypothetical protein